MRCAVDSFGHLLVSAGRGASLSGFMAGSGEKEYGLAQKKELVFVSHASFDCVLVDVESGKAGIFSRLYDV